MNRRTVLLIAALLPNGSPLFAQSHPEYIQFSPGPVKGALYKPDAGPAPHVAILIIHRTANVLASPAARQLARRGFMVLGVNPRSDNNEAAVNFEANALDIKSGVELLRKQPGITRILLWGHSGGGPATSFYQAVAEQGPGYCRGPNKLSECDDSLAGLPKADGLILVDAHPGISVNRLRTLNAAVLDERDPAKLDPALDPFSPANGYKDGAAQYTEDFKRRYFKAQADRMNRLIDRALAELKAMKSGTAPYPDNDAMIVPRFEGARLMELDPRIHHGTLKPQKLPAGARVGQAQRQLRERRGHDDAAVVPERECHSRERLAGRHRLVFEQQLDRLRAAAHHRPDAGDRDGSPLFHPRQRDSLREIRQPRQGLHRHRGGDARHLAVHGVRDDAGPVRQQREELLRLRDQVGCGAVLSLHRSAHSARSASSGSILAARSAGM